MTSLLLSVWPGSRPDNSPIRVVAGETSLSVGGFCVARPCADPLASARFRDGLEALRTGKLTADLSARRDLSPVGSSQGNGSSASRAPSEKFNSSFLTPRIVVAACGPITACQVLLDAVTRPEPCGGGLTSRTGGNNGVKPYHATQKETGAPPAEGAPAKVGCVNTTTGLG
jgi:hypothetical protein